MHETKNIQFCLSNKIVSYKEAIFTMEKYAKAIAEQNIPGLLWFLEHPPIYTAGTSAKHNDLLSPSSLPVFETGRGGQYTYHGPGQRIVYVMLNLRHYKCDIRAYITHLENWIIASLAQIDVKAAHKKGRTGVWVEPKDYTSIETEMKIAAIGVRIRKWVTMHGVAININPNLNHYKNIIPCGIKEYGVTSIEALGKPATMQTLDNVLKTEFQKEFNVIILDCGKKYPIL